MTAEQWRVFLRACSAELVNDEEVNYYGHVPESAMRDAWLGYEPASPAEIAAGEERLGATLPPSLRAFYSVTNGWRTVSHSVWEILPVAQIGWLEDVVPHLWTPPENLAEVVAGDSEYADEQYVRVNRSLVVSGAAADTWWLLDPQTLDAAGEWAAGSWASWNPAMEWTANSFAALFRREYEMYLRVRDDLTEENRYETYLKTSGEKRTGEERGESYED